MPGYADPGFDTTSAEVHAAREAGWLATTPYGFAVLRYDAANELLTDRRFRQGNARWPEQQGVHEGLRQVAAQLSLADVELLGAQAWSAACCAVALEPASGCDVLALLCAGERHHKATKQKRALGLTERALVGAEAIAVAVLGELLGDSVQRRDRARVRRGDRSPDRREQERSVGPRVGG